MRAWLAWQGAEQVPLALGQVVLALTAVRGIDAVQPVSAEGHLVEMALPVAFSPRTGYRN